MPEPQYPIGELVSQQVAIVLAKLTAAPATSGYNTQLATVERFKHTPGNVPAHLKAILFPPEDTVFGDEMTPVGDTAWDRLQQVTVYAYDTEDSTVPYEQLLNGIRADVEKVLLAEIANGTNFNGYVQNLWAIGAVPTIEASEPPGINVFFRIYYRHGQYDPFVKG